MMAGITIKTKAAEERGLGEEFTACFEESLLTADSSS